MCCCSFFWLIINWQDSTDIMVVFWQRRPWTLGCSEFHCWSGRVDQRIVWHIPVHDHNRGAHWCEGIRIRHRCARCSRFGGPCTWPGRCGKWFRYWSRVNWLEIPQNNTTAWINLILINQNYFWNSQTHFYSLKRKKLESEWTIFDFFPRLNLKSDETDLYEVSNWCFITLCLKKWILYCIFMLRTD